MDEKGAKFLSVMIIAIINMAQYQHQEIQLGMMFNVMNVDLYDLYDLYGMERRG